MHASPMNSASTSLYQLVAYLTRPLVAVYPAQTVLQLQLFLHANLASLFLTETSLSPFTLLLAPGSLPPTPIYAACLQSGVAWPQWIRVLGENTLYIFVMENSLKVRVGEVGDAVTIWSEEPVEVPSISRMKMQTQTQSQLETDESPMALKLKAMLDSVRARSSSIEQCAKSIALPTLLTTTHLSRQISDDADDISDSESDSESTTSSSLFSDMSSTESMTSASSTSSPVSKSSDLPLLIESMKLSTKAPALSKPTPTQHLSRSQRRLARVTVDKSKADVCQYKYQGGQTSVMTGGVMLGGATKPVATAIQSRSSPSSAVSPAAWRQASTTRASTKPRTAKVMLGSDSSNNWRARV